MDSAVRHLRDGVLPDAASCATCCIFDNLSVIGGSLVLQHVVRSFIAAMRQGRSQATVVRLVDLTGALAPLAAEAAASAPRAAGATAAPDVEYIDLHSDPWGWHRAAVAAAREGQGPEQAAAGPGPGSGAAAAPAAASAAGNARTHAGADPVLSLDELCSQLTREPASQSCQLEPGAGEAAAAAAGEAEAAEATAAPPAAAAGRAGGVCVVLGCLSTLMERYNGSSNCSSSGSSGYGGADGGGGGEWAGLAMLEALRRAPSVSCVLAAVHTDLHSEAAVEGLRRAASCVLQLAPLSDLQQRLAAAALAGSGRAAQLRGGVLAGRLDCRTRRRTGRVKVESELYSISLQPQPLSPAPVATASAAAAAAAATAVPAVHFFSMPPQVDTPDPRALLRLQPPASSSSSSAAAAATAAATAGAGGAMVAPAASAGAGAGAASGGGGGGQPLGLLGGVGSAEELARAVGSSMRLVLTEEERRAKQAVVLPYQHTGSGLRGPAAAAYAAGDHAGYLPPAAGGRGPGGGAGGAGGSGGEAAGGVGAGGGGGGGGGGRQGGLGHILYVRDSASEQDSDQDLDEDLDI